MKRLIPYGLSNFERLITENNYYIDKTRYIEYLEKVNYPVFLRPRMFGKTLFTEMLKWYYDIKAKDRFNEIFGNLYIGKNPTGNQNKYFVLTLNFSGMDTFVGSEEELRLQFYRHLISQFKQFLTHYEQFFDINETYIRAFYTIYESNAVAAFDEILRLVNKANSKLYLCIDEYDSLTNALAIRYRYSTYDDNIYLNILQKGGFFRAFFEAIKSATQTAIHQVYITGILPITISDMKSGFNIATWITFAPNFINMLGITESEFDTLIQKIYTDYPITLDKQQIKATIKQYYNGYCFCQGFEQVYNPMMTLYFLDYVINYNQYPPYLLDRNIRIDYNQIAFLFGQNTDRAGEIMTKIIDKQTYNFFSTLDVAFDMIDYKEGRRITEGLFYSGILTYSNIPDVLKIPNLVTYTFTLDYFNQIKKFEVDNEKSAVWMEEYQHKTNVVALIEGFFKDVIQQFPGSFFSNVNESFYHGLFFQILFNSTTRNNFEVLPEYSLPNGRVDLMLRSFPGAKVMCELHDLFEIKCVAKNASDAKLLAKLKEAKSQMQDYLTGDYANWRGIAVCFRGNKDFKYQVFNAE